MLVGKIKIQLVENFINWLLDPDSENPGKPTNPDADPKNKMCGNSIFLDVQYSAKQLEKKPAVALF